MAQIPGLDPTPPQEVTAVGIERGGIDILVRDWNEQAAAKARELVDRYGHPDEITRERLIWHNNGEWKRTEIVNEEVRHNFPQEHRDFLYQTVEFPVPEDRVEEIIRFSGNILIDRVKGEVTVRCENEEANRLTLNLMNQIIDGRKEAQSARDTLAETALEGRHQDLRERLHFTWQQFDQPADADRIYGAPDRDSDEETPEDDGPAE
jgi:hypothetical protein